MEDILASIRRILSEDEAPAAGTTPPAAPPAGDGVLVLDPAMMVTEKPAVPEPADPEPATLEPAIPELAAPEAAPEVEPTPMAALPPVAEPTPGLLAPEAASAAAFSVEGLVRTLTDRTARVRSDGPTVEDIVREEMRPLLKSWLDANLPPMVERLVRVEIERIVGRVVP
jgi:cell pole-organizing protein PopZ